MHPLLPKLFEYVKSHNLLDAPLGRIVLDGDRLFINNDNPQCVAQEAQRLEVHRKYMDVHIVLEGKERIGWRPLKDCSQVLEPYDESRDVAFYGDAPTSYIDLIPGQFFIVYPEDPHAPIIGEGKIRKICAKLLLDEA